MAKHAYPRASVRAHGRHRKPRTTRPVVRTAVAAGGLTGGALVAGVSLAPVAHAASADDFARLRQCESGGNYQTNTGNGYYGAYQFDLGTWHGLGYSGLPSDAAPATQDEAAQRLQAQRGWSPWPACASKLGLGSGGTSHSADVVAASASAPVVVSAPRGPVVLSEEYASTWRQDVRTLQQQLHGLGLTVTADGYFGPETDAAVRHFQHAAGITVDGLAGPETLRALHHWHPKAHHSTVHIFRF